MQFIQLSHRINIFSQCLAEVKLSCKGVVLQKADISHWNNCKVSLSTIRISLSRCAEVHRRVNDQIFNDPCRVHPLLQENLTKRQNLPELFGKIGRERRGAGRTERFSGYRPYYRSIDVLKRFFFSYKFKYILLFWWYHYNFGDIITSTLNTRDISSVKKEK